MKREEVGRAGRCVIRVSGRGGRKGRKKFMEVRNCREILEARSNIVVGCLQGLSMGMADSVGSILSPTNAEVVKCGRSCKCIMSFCKLKSLHLSTSVRSWQRQAVANKYVDDRRAAFRWTNWRSVLLF